MIVFLVYVSTLFLALGYIMCQWSNRLDICILVHNGPN